jgi:alkylhydroperoxidase family enzyme
MAQLSVFQTLLRQPRLSRAISGLLLSLLTEKAALDARLRELIIMRIGWSTGSVYEWTQHWRIALDLGVDDQDLLGVRNWPDHGFDFAERSVLAATDDVLTSGVISDRAWADCEKALGADSPALLELVAAIGTWTMISTLLRTLRVPLEDGVQAWPPEGLVPAELGRHG